MAGQLQLGDFRYNLFKGSIDAAPVRLTIEGTAIEIGEAHVRWSPRGGLRLQLVRPNIVARDTGKPKASETAVGMAARPWTALEQLQGAELVDGRLELQDAKGVAYLVLGDDRRHDAGAATAAGRSSSGCATVSSVRRSASCRRWSASPT